MTTLDHPPADPFLDVRGLARLQQLRALRSDEAVTLADLRFALDAHDRLAAGLDGIRASAARTALDLQALADRQRGRTRDRDIPLLTRPAGLVVLAVVVVLAILLGH